MALASITTRSYRKVKQQTPFEVELPPKAKVKNARAKTRKARVARELSVARVCMCHQSKPAPERCFLRLLALLCFLLLD